MTQEEAIRLIEQSISETLEDRQVEISMDTHLINDGVFDSLDVLVFMSQIEDKSGKKLPPFTDQSITEIGLFRIGNLVKFLTEA